MEKITMFVLENCPYCRQARKDLAELMKEEAYQNLEVTMIDEARQPEIANQYDYYYVPTFYLGNQKKLEGALTREQIQNFLDEALRS